MNKWMWYVACENEASDQVHYWTGSGLSPNFEAVLLFPDRAAAFASWNDHSGEFPVWKAVLGSTKRRP